MNARDTNAGRTPDEPALFLTTQTTIPQLTAIMFALSLAMIAISADAQWPSSHIVGTVGTKDSAFMLLGLSAISFLFVIVACVKSHAWDYHALRRDRLASEGLSAEEWYVTRCSRRSRLWHRAAIFVYNAGFFLVMGGVALLVWPVSFGPSIAVVAALVGALIYLLVVTLTPDWANSIGERMADRFANR